MAPIEYFLFRARPFPYIRYNPVMEITDKDKDRFVVLTLKPEWAGVKSAP